MFPQKSSKIPQWIAGVVIAIYAINNPASAAEFVTKVMDAIQTFANSLG